MRVSYAAPSHLLQEGGVDKPAQVVGAKDELKCGSGVMGRGTGLGHGSL